MLPFCKYRNTYNLFLDPQILGSNSSSSAMETRLCVVGKENGENKELMQAIEVIESWIHVAHTAERSLEVTTRVSLLLLELDGDVLYVYKFSGFYDLWSKNHMCMSGNLTIQQSIWFIVCIYTVKFNVSYSTWKNRLNLVLPGDCNLNVGLQRTSFSCVCFSFFS